MNFLRSYIAGQQAKSRDHELALQLREQRFKQAQQHKLLIAKQIQLDNEANRIKAVLVEQGPSVQHIPQMKVRQASYLKRRQELASAFKAWEKQQRRIDQIQKQKDELSGVNAIVKTTNTLGKLAEATTRSTLSFASMHELNVTQVHTDEAKERLVEVKNTLAEILEPRDEDEDEEEDGEEKVLEETSADEMMLNIRRRQGEGGVPDMDELRMQMEDAMRDAPRNEFDLFLEQRQQQQQQQAVVISEIEILRRQTVELQEEKRRIRAMVRKGEEEEGKKKKSIAVQVNPNAPMARDHVTTPPI